LDLDSTTTFTANQKYTQEGWYVNQVLQSSTDTPTDITFNPTNTFTYIPYNQAYLVINNAGLSTTENNTKNTTNSNTLLWILAIILLGGILGALIYKKTHRST